MYEPTEEQREEYERYLQARREMYQVLEKVEKSSRKALDAIRRVVDDGHLRSTLTMLRDDIVLRRMMDSLVK